MINPEVTFFDCLKKRKMRILQHWLQRSTLTPISTVLVASCRSTDVERPHRCCHLANSVDISPLAWMFLLVPDYPGGPGQEAVKRSCVCLRVLVTLDRRVLSKTSLCFTANETTLHRQSPGHA